MITGDVGAGKTVAVRAAVAGLDPTRHQVIYVANPAFGTRGLYVQVVRALGAQPVSIMKLVMRDVAALLVVGVGAGVIASIWVSRLVEQLLFGLKANDAETLALAAGSLVAIALLASYLPARRAMRVDPIKALRYE